MNNLKFFNNFVTNYKATNKNQITFENFLIKAFDYPIQYFRDFRKFLLDAVEYYKTENMALMFEFNQEKKFFASYKFLIDFEKFVKDIYSLKNSKKITIFEGKPGSGKSTFLKNFYNALENYNQKEEGALYQITWKLEEDVYYTCPYHCHPVSILPKEHRMEILERSINSKRFIENMYHNKSYEWMIHSEPCHICKKIYDYQLKNRSIKSIYNNIYVEKNELDRHISNGLSIVMPNKYKSMQYYNDKKNSELLYKYFPGINIDIIYSDFASVNNGIYAIMDLKGSNVDNFNNIHNLVTEEINKVHHNEEYLNVVYMAVANEDDLKEIKEKESFMDRINIISIPYNMNYKTEIEIYQDHYKDSLNDKFMPHILALYARLITISRMSSKTTVEFDNYINPVNCYEQCGNNRLIIKTDILNDKIPEWLKEEDKKKLTDEAIKNIKMSSDDGVSGISGRYALNLLNEFIYTSSQDNNDIIDIKKFETFFWDIDDLNYTLTTIVDLVKYYNYIISNEVKQSLFSSNERIIVNDILNYLFCLTLEGNEKDIECVFTKKKIKNKENELIKVEKKLTSVIDTNIELFRKEQLNVFTTKTVHGDIKKSKQFQKLFNLYKRNLEKNAIDELNQDSFINALKCYDTDKFSTFDKSIQKRIKFAIDNLINKFEYNNKTAKKILLYFLELKK
jgi:predicted Ser/Thr protein kinase